MEGSAACGAFTCTTENRWLTTFRARLGYAFDRWLPYLTAGGAYGDVRATSNDPASPGASDTRLGWTAGVGLEYAFAGNWTAKIEYLYVDLGSFNCGAACPPNVATNDIDFKASILRFGLNYKFSGRMFGHW